LSVLSALPVDDPVAIRSERFGGGTAQRTYWRPVAAGEIADLVIAIDSSRGPALIRRYQEYSRLQVLIGVRRSQLLRCNIPLRQPQIRRFPRAHINGPAVAACHKRQISPRNGTEPLYIAGIRRNGKDLGILRAAFSAIQHRFVRC